MKLSTKDVKKLKDKGVDPSVILDLLLEEDEDPGKAMETPKNEKQEKAPEAQTADTTQETQEEWLAGKSKKPEVKKPEPITPKDVKQANDIQDQILKAIEKLTGAVQTSNLLNAGSDGPDVDKTEDILASIINPTGGK